MQLIFSKDHRVVVFSHWRRKIFQSVSRSLEDRRLEIRIGVEFWVFGSRNGAFWWLAKWVLLKNGTKVGEKKIVGCSAIPKVGEQHVDIAVASFSSNQSPLSTATIQLCRCLLRYPKSAGMSWGSLRAVMHVSLAPMCWAPGRASTWTDLVSEAVTRACCETSRSNRLTQVYQANGC